MARSNESPPIRVADHGSQPVDAAPESKAIEVGQEYEVLGAICGPNGRVSDVLIQPTDSNKFMLVYRNRYLVVEPWAGEYVI
jgi:hypothetical protein